MEAVVDALRQKRLQLHLSHDEMAQRLGVSRTTWFDTVRGRRPVGRAIKLGVTLAGADFTDVASLLEAEEVSAA